MSADRDADSAWMKTGLGLVFLLILLLQRQVPTANLMGSLDRLGYEYGNVASSLLAGRGYSDPFGYPTGATAWMTPVGVLVFWAVFSLFGVKSLAAAQALLVLKAAGVTFALGVLLRTALVTGHAEARKPMLVLAAIALVGRQDWLAWPDMDEWLVILLSSLTLRTLATREQALRPWQIVLAALLPLSSPALTFGFGLVMLPRCFQSQRRQAVILLLVMALSAGAWSARNFHQMGTPMLLKSNLGYEFYLSNELCPRGLFHTQTLVRFHPIHAWNRERAGFARLGETRACQWYSAESLRLIRENPTRIAQNMAARAWSIFVRAHLTGDFQPARHRLKAADAAKLSAAHLLWVDETSQHWLCLEDPEAQVSSQIDRLGLTNPQAARQSWDTARNDLLLYKNQPERVARALAYSLIPTLALLLGLWLGGWRQREFRDVALLYVGYFLPYVVVSHYDRYLVAALGMQIWLVWWTVWVLSQKAQGVGVASGTTYS